MSDISNYLCKLLFICFATLSLSACIVKTDSPLFSLDEMVTPIADSSLLVVIEANYPDYFTTVKQANNTYLIDSTSGEPELKATFYTFPDKAGYFVLQMEAADEVGKFSYFLAAIDGNQLTVSIGNKQHAPKISSKQQILSYFSEILSSGEIESTQFTLYDLDDDEQAATAAVLVEKMDKARKIRSGTTRPK